MTACKYGCTDTTTEASCPDHGDTKGLRVIFPNGTGCYYVDADHSYWRMRPDNGCRGTRLSGVTTVVKTLDTDNSNLLRWAARTNGIGIAALAAPVIDALERGDGDVTAGDLRWLRSADGIWARLEAEQMTYEDVRDRKGTVGDNVHRLAFEALASGRAVPHLDELTEEERGYAKAVMAFWLDHEPEADLVEQILADTEAGVAGRVDFIGTLQSCGRSLCPCGNLAGKRGVLDAKTGKWIGVTEHAQVQGYRNLAAACGHGDTEWAALLKLLPDGTYRLIPSVAAPADFVKALETYRAAGRIKREAA